MPEPSDRQELNSIAASLRRHLQRRERGGIRLLPKGDVSKKVVAVTSDANVWSGSESDLFSEPSSVSQAKSLEELRDVIGDCRKCKLWSGRTHLVFGVGNPKAKLMFIGEGPGRDEDLQGEPFVGRAGQLLTDIITKGMAMKREDVYIANVVKCRPPANRNPQPDEVAACEPV